ncbi:MAG TPA: DUF1501 domain-containing protein [Gemmatales bacterium]|nr:DUF1501 domain-containing protein [Gemmatales bacterium]HMP60683.1 DUF1501 domain-containing protein [Gemmatales bacterium]
MTPAFRPVLSRRAFFTSTASGVGLAALASLLADEGRAAEPTNPLEPKEAPLPAKAKACICIYLEGGPSQLDLFDPKPKLNELHGQPLPESLVKNVRFAFIQKEGARILGSTRQFGQHGQSGMIFSDFLPNLASCADDICMIRSMHTDQFNHHPGQLLMNCGSPFFGRPSMGSWLTYGLGSASKNLPGYVVLTSGVGTSGGTSNWSSGFLPSHFQGVLFRQSGDPVLNLSNPAGLSPAMQERTIAGLRDLNAQRFQHLGDPDIASRIAAYELAFRMQSAAPELIDLSKETPQTLDAYGVDRPDRGQAEKLRGRSGQYATFAANCLLARRLVERGVRFVNIVHASWDHHNNLDDGLGFNCGMADQPIAALLKDLKQRGLLDSTMVLWLSEFGRTPLGENRPGFPKINGRDHHPFAFTIWGAGGGLKGGTTIGQTDELGWGVVEDPIHINDLHATILRCFGFDHLKLTYRFQGRDFRLTDVGGKVVDQMLA